MMVLTLPRLALDYCVLDTVLGATKMGFRHAAKSGYFEHCRRWIESPLFAED
jgi:hypothetical protein